jgi:hypothetical protein
MGIGLGIVLLLVGLILVLDIVQFDTPYVADEALGVLLVVLGIITLVLSLVWASIRSRRSRVEEHHYDHRI